MPQSPQLRDNHIFSGGKGIVGQSSTRKREQLRRQCPQTVAEQVLGEQCTSHLRACSLPNPTDEHLQWVQDSLRYGIKSILFGPPDTCRQFWATDIFWTATPQWSSTRHFPSLSSSKKKSESQDPLHAHTDSYEGCWNSDDSFRTFPYKEYFLSILLKFQHTIYLSSNAARSDLFKYQGIKLYFFILLHWQLLKIKKLVESWLSKWRKIVIFL